METSFSSLALAEPLQKAIAEMGYTSMTPIQAKAIPLVLGGRDVMGAAQTGTGKTAAFSLPLLQKMMRHESGSVSPARHPVRAVVLLPTRELADQVAESIRGYAKHTKLKVACVFGGMDMKPQTAELKAGVEVLIATPGRLLDHIEARNCVLNQVEYVVLDEADRMLDIGFLPDLQRILGHLPKQRQTLLFSATFSGEIRKLAQSYLQNPELVEVARANATATNIEQRMIEVAEKDKRKALVKLLREEGMSQAIIFSNSKLGTARLARALELDGFSTAALHGDKTQDERLKALEAFKRGEVNLLVATDVAARGLDVTDLPAVFNFDLPFHAEDYVHRIGRTGRAGAKGVAISFVEPEQKRLLAEIEKLVNKKFTLESIALPEAPARHGHGSGQGERESYGRRDAQQGRGGDRGGRTTDRPDRHERPYRERRERKESSDAYDVGYALPRHARHDPLFNQPYREPTTSRKAPWELGGEEGAKAGSGIFTRHTQPKHQPLAVLLGGSGK